MYKGVFFVVFKEGRRERENDNIVVNFIEFYLKFWCEWMKDVYFFWEYKMSIFIYFKWFSNGMLVYFVEKKERERIY